jgi:UDP-2,3-diacylglucosamine pyrophosphatase LpxH
MARDTTIVISDIHIANGQKYSWFLPPYPAKLVQMLNQVAGDPSVAEVVLLGDLLDLWLYPVDVVPWTAAQIMEANPDVSTAIRNVVANVPVVYFMNGNHDMELSTADLQVFNSGGKSIQWTAPAAYSALYGNQRHLEHGNAVDMFNAPDPSSDTIEGYPFGYFVTRLVATAANQSLVWALLQKLLQAIGRTYLAFAPGAVRAPESGAFLIIAMVDLLEKLAEVNDDTPIRFQESPLDDRITVGSLRNYYGNLFITWLSQYGLDIMNPMLAGFLSDGLDWYAQKLQANSPAPQVIVMGHTHHAESKTTYGNDGCWCIPSALGHGDAAPAYAQIIGNTGTVIPWNPTNPIVRGS